MQMKGIKKNVLLLLLLMFVGSNAFAQKTLIDVSMDPSSILIGEQTVIHLSITTDQNHPVLIAVPTDTLMQGVEVVSMLKRDTSKIENNRQVIKQDILVTSFDSSLYLLPPFKVIDGTDTVLSKQIALKVSTVPVDVNHPEKFYDIKDVWKPPFVLADYYPIIFGILLALFLICAAVYIIKRIRSRKSLIPFKKAAPKLPPDELALKELDEIRQKKLWQQGRNKEYYTQITETLRRYMVDRFGLGAMEMTSAEILEVLRSNEEAKPVYDALKQILELSDYVKFAKMNPLPDENDLSLTHAYTFVKETKPKAPEVPEEDAEKPEDASKPTDNSIKNKEE